MKNNFTTSLFHIDIAEESASNSTSSIPPVNDLDRYVQALVSQMRGSSNYQEFDFSDESDDFQSDCKEILFGQDYGPASARIANRLLIVEQASQRWVIPAGMLLIAKVAMAELTILVVAKVDRSEFLNPENFRIASGLPSERKIFKGCILECNLDKSWSRIMVFDSSSTFAKYWWESFLKLRAKRSSEKNTLDAFQHINALFNKNLKALSPADYQQIRNATIHYFRNQTQFSISTFIDTVIGNYQSINPELTPEKIEQVKGALRRIPTSKGFDQTFPIAFGAIKAKIKETIRLTSEIDLTMRNDIPEGIISAFLDANVKGIKIITDDGYQRFKR
jgi:37-kD nucleoid-associated bacterial protein